MTYVARSQVPAEKYYVAFPAPGYVVDHGLNVATPHKNLPT